MTNVDSSGSAAAQYKRLQQVDSTETVSKRSSLVPQCSIFQSYSLYLPYASHNNAIENLT